MVAISWKVLECLTPRELHQRHQPDHADGQHQRRRVRQDRLAVFAERHRGERDRRREADGRRHPARHETEGRVKGPAEEIVLAARARKHRAEFAVGKHPAQRDDAADRPQQQDRKAGRDVLDLKAEAGEDADADHVGDDDGDRHHDRNGRAAAGARAGPCRASRFCCRHVGPYLQRRTPEPLMVQAGAAQFKQR